ncbi:MAG: MaoC/PaaZ C-terminal domain-containing protein [Myxococcota bacterium]|nr:MaoC/PaaZ C-terminal domain-containing protein [Myxococcota bacterium]
MTDTKLTLESVSAGQELPELRIPVTPTTVVLGALASRDWRPMHHDKDFAVERNGTKHVFVNTPHNAAYFERYLTDWTGPHGRLGKIRFRMKDSVFPGDEMVFHGRVSGVREDEAGCGWVDLDLWLTVGDKTTTECNASVAVPVREGDNPWTRRGDDWRP